MRHFLVPCLGGLLSLLGCAASSRTPATAYPAEKHTDILLVATPHLAQLYKEANPLTDVLTTRRQTELAAFRDQVLRFRPDAIMVEELPSQQARLDSLYTLYQQDKLNPNTMPGGRSEIYQLAFPMAKRLGLNRIYCVNSEGGTSQSILHEGTNIKLYQEGTTEHRAYYAPTVQQWEKGDLTMAQLLTFLNTPAFLQQLHTLVYRTPARVTDGTLKADEMVDAAFIKPHYVGAEFISVMYNRDLKIYSNIVTTQLATRSSRVLTIIGGRHVASLQGIFGTDPSYRVVPSATYLKQK
ncbi:hypothetical protein HMJ29_06715 [Hymenobacter taeanensis]|uniref:Lipoprotein n=1 Tax=Hymenobacter taeanensis TaxID=2735321 RepID=A0A6M6BHX0_9BACT|nr:MULTISPECIES: DUF5694 domain-containing protein [Hymenobacter]QJX46645.1 hypothetical protein HMJ29_06715 [Hymenobacter taeanensis]UOQ80509.1 DUF5694 domain-containing protein [Hymenobacter sp. 5414T-23]